jgi:dTDP-4-dehydrorhamnose reductase
MRILITGADGQLGNELQRTLKQHELVLGIWPEFDLLKPEVEPFVRSARPDVIIHAAAYTDVDGAEAEPETVYAVNVEGTRRVAQAGAQCGARLIYLSTDYVFDGRKSSPYSEKDAPNPVNVYGQSKLDGERMALRYCPNTMVLRTSWLYGLRGRNFVRTIVKLASEQTELRVVSDQRGSPTYANDLAMALKHVLERKIQGLVHAAGMGDCTWYEFACAIVSELRMEVAVQPIRTSESARRAPRPSYSVLGNNILGELGIVMPHWRDALSRFIEEIRAVSVSNDIKEV